jgi:oligosaccharyltransferase complex subunit alpha (ribophorin I)
VVLCIIGNPCFPVAHFCLLQFLIWRAHAVHERLAVFLSTMKTSGVFSAFLSLLSLASAAGADRKSSSTSTTLPATFKPPQVFRNANLVHVISVEKNYVKESINVLVENIDKAAQQEYYVPFTADHMSRLGGVEVKDRKDSSAGPFLAEAVDIDQERLVGSARISAASAS